MNKERRTRLEKIIDKIQDIRMELEELMQDVEDVKYEEEEARDNMPESLQESDRYYTMDENVDDLESATNVDWESPLDEIEEYLQNVVDR